ncbi:MAG: fatty acid desaturase [Alphaproteobacteria bacterium]
MKIYLPAVLLLGAVHILAALSLPAMYIYGVHAGEMWFHFLTYLWAGLGITVLYHRAWTHRAVVLSPVVEFFFAVGALFCLQNTALKWIASHIRHHQYTDKDLDPYNIQKGFWWAHMEWIYHEGTPEAELPSHIRHNFIAQWQASIYWPMSALFNIALPIAVSIHVGSPWWMGLLLTGLRLTATTHIVSAINSICHYYGTQPFTQDVSARNVWWFPFSLGEQYHNYHHAFPRDYRHGIRFYDFDPTKWLLWALEKAGLAHNLFTMPTARVHTAMAAVNHNKEA